MGRNVTDHGSDRVGSGGFKVFNVRVGSDQEVFETSRIGSARLGGSIQNIIDRVGNHSYSSAPPF